MRFLPHVITRLLLDEIYSPVGIRFRFNINYIWVVDAVTDIINSSYIFHGIRTCIDYHFTVSNATINQVTEPQKCSKSVRCSWCFAVLHNCWSSQLFFFLQYLTYTFVLNFGKFGRSSACLEVSEIVPPCKKAIWESL